MLCRLDRRIGGARAGSAGFVYALDVAGQYLLDRESGRKKRRPSEPSLTFLAHTLAITELFVRLREAEREESVEVLEFSPEPWCWRDFFGPAGARVTLKPDAFVRIAIGDVEDLWFVEVDRATHAIPALETKFRTYRQYWSSGREQRMWDDTLPRVLWLAPNATRVRKIVDVITKQPQDAQALFVARPYDEAVTTLTPERPS